MTASCVLFAMVIIFIAAPSYAASDHKMEHGGQIFHRFQLEADVGDSKGGTLSTWDFDGWIGGDDDKLWLKSEGEVADDKTESAEFWALYSRNVAEFWDVQAGVRYDVKPVPTAYAVIGIDGLAPYFFETAAHLFISDEGDASARIRQENEFLITQQLILQPYIEANLFAQDVEEQDMGRGLATAEIGLQTRYEITRKFAPYVDIRYERSFGETRAIAHDNGESTDDFIASIGLRLVF